MITILIVLSLYTSQSHTSFSQEFDDPAACEEARKLIKQHIGAKSWSPEKSLVLCMPKRSRG